MPPNMSHKSHGGIVQPASTSNIAAALTVQSGEQQYSHVGVPHSPAQLVDGTPDSVTGARYLMPAQAFTDLQLLASTTQPHVNRAFNFDDSLTPEYSTYSTDEQSFVDDLLWAQEQEQNIDQLAHGNDYTMNFDDTVAQHHADALGLGGQHLPSPQPTHFSTPEPATNSKGQSPPSMNVMAMLPTPQSDERRIASLALQIDARLNADALRAQPVSPVIRISTHSRGDSPARTQMPVRAGSKRSAQDRGADQFEPPSMLQSSTTLRLPADLELEAWVVDDEEDAVTARAGMAPDVRHHQEISSINDNEEQAKLDSKIQEVNTWLAATSLESARAFIGRSNSTGMRSSAAQQSVRKNIHVPGPGILVDEDSDYYPSDDDEDPESLTSSDHPETERADLPPAQQPREIPPSEQEPLPRQFFRRAPWQDPAHVAKPDDGDRFQPETSRAAMYMFEQRAKNWETASRAATWGTGRQRRLSDSEVDSIVGDNKTRHLSLSKRTRDRGASIRNTLHEARERVRQSIPRRTSSHQKKPSFSITPIEIQKVASPEPIEQSNTDHMTIGPISRIGSLHKPKSPAIHPTNKQTVALNGLAGLTVPEARPDEHEVHENLLTRALRRVRSNSNVHKTPKSPNGLSTLLREQGGMPVLPLLSPMHSEDRTVEAKHTPIPDSQVVMQDIISIKMDLAVKSAYIVPNFEGFRTHAAELNPRLEPYLLERIAHNQVYRYKRLIKSKVDHKQLVESGTCPSKELCSTFGDVSEELPPRPTARDSAITTFKIPTGNDSDIDESNFDGLVTSTLFPEGIPLPPTKRLPARFECPICFQIKSFQKPSDWTKHVHEDVQPFTCTFPTCGEPKSFKRKADWVRHENERHRQLEWWQCNLYECNHKCFRKDNFVQHLVREHKKKEPKVKSKVSVSSKSRGRANAHPVSAEETEFWALVDTCHHESQVGPRDEACKFCGNTCATWKKLGVHVGKHMEQIAMPILELVKQRNVTKDTVVSPIEPFPSRPQPFMYGQQSLALDYGAASPFTHSGGSNYQTPSAGHSPALMPMQAQPGLIDDEGRLMAGNMTLYGVSRDIAYGVHGNYASHSRHHASNPYGQQLPYMHQYTPTAATYPLVAVRMAQPPPNHAPGLGIEQSFIPTTMHDMKDGLYVHQTPYYSSPEMQYEFPHHGTTVVSHCHDMTEPNGTLLQGTDMGVQAGGSDLGSTHLGYGPEVQQGQRPDSVQAFYSQAV